MNGKKKKLQDIFTDQKIDRNSKSDILVVQHQEDIIWIVGHTLSEKYKITEKSTRAFRIIFSK
jgi:tRNA(Ile)-lysidine synthase